MLSYVVQNFLGFDFFNQKLIIIHQVSPKIILME